MIAQDDYCVRVMSRQYNGFQIAVNLHGMKNEEWYSAYVGIPKDVWNDIKDQCLNETEQDSDWPLLDEDRLALPIPYGCTFYDEYIPESEECPDLKTTYDNKPMTVIGWDYDHGYRATYGDVLRDIEKVVIAITDKITLFCHRRNGQ